MPTKPETCRGCALETRGTGFMPGFSTLARPTILVVGEAPSQSDLTLNKPFQGSAGYFLDKMLRMAGIARESLGFHNTISCVPPGSLAKTSGRAQALYQCAPNLDETIQRMNPRVILTLGDTALERLTGKTGIQRHRGFWYFGPRGIPVMPTFHPAFLMPGRTQGELKKQRPSRFVGTVLWDLLRAKQRAADPAVFRRPTERYLIDPPPGVLQDFIRDYKNALANRGPALMLTYDIETPGKAAKGEDEIPMLQQPIIRVGFSFEAGYAVTVPWRPLWLPGIAELLASQGQTTGWNSYSFDNPVLEWNLGRPFLQGRHYDMMRAWHVLQSDLPKGLEFVASFFTNLFPWKDLSGTDPGRYNAIDCDAQIQNSYGIREALQPRGQWDIFERLLMGIAPLLTGAGKRGLPIDLEAQAILREELRRDLLAELIAAQTEVPESFHQEKLYVRKPNSRPTREVTIDKSIPACSACGKERPTAVHYRATKTRPACDGAPVPQLQSVVAFRAVPDLSPERGLDAVRDDIGDSGFNVLSPPQLTAYANTYRHLQLLQSSGIKVEGVDDTVLGHLIKRFGKDHPIYARTRTVREKNKMLGTYIEGYAPDDQGLIHTTFNDNPSTLRLASQNVNLQNVHANIKRTIRAKPGWRFVEVDSAAIEALMVGFQAQSPQYIRLAAQGVHDFVLAKALGLDWTPDALKITKAKENKPARDVKKMTVHLSNFGGTPRTMKQQAPDTYTTEAMARNEQRFYFDVCPDIEQWQKRTRAIVARNHVLVNPWGFHQYFYEVFDGDRPGSDYNRCLGAGPQSMAGLFMRENLWRLRATEWEEFLYGNCTIHDSLGLYLPQEKAIAGAEFLLDLMTRPVPQLDNMVIGAEAKMSPVGGTWAEMTEYRTIRVEDPLALSTWHLAIAS